MTVKPFRKPNEIEHRQLNNYKYSHEFIILFEFLIHGNKEILSKT